MVQRLEGLSTQEQMCTGTQLGLNPKPLLTSIFFVATVIWAARHSPGQGPGAWLPRPEAPGPVPSLDARITLQTLSHKVSGTKGNSGIEL